MTYTFTHLTLEGLAIWELLPKKWKQYYKEHRWEFILINIFAILPDADILFGYHRSYTHSIIIPTTLVFAFLISEGFSKLTGTFSNQTERYFRFLKLALFMWILHIFLDFGWGSLMLFWPLNNNFYDFTVFFRFENKPWLFLPLTLLGIIPDWTILNYQEGLNSFFINLSQTQREQMCGHYINFYIETVMLHVLLLIVWVVVIFIPSFKPNKKNSEKRKRGKNYIKVFVKVLFSRFTVLGSFIILLGITLGPIIGSQYVNKYTFTAELKVTDSYFDPTIGTEISLPKNAVTTIVYTSEVGLVNYTTSIIITNEEHFWTFFNTFDDVSKSYLNRTIDYTNLLKQYNELVQNAKSEAYFQKDLVGEENQKGITIELNNTKQLSKVYFMALISSWNVSKSFVYSANFQIIYTYNRDTEQLEGVVLSIIGVAVVLCDQIVLMLNAWKKHKNSTQKTTIKV